MLCAARKFMFLDLADKNRIIVILLNKN